MQQFLFPKLKNMGRGFFADYVSQAPDEYCKYNFDGQHPEYAVVYRDRKFLKTDLYKSRTKNHKESRENWSDRHYIFLKEGKRETVIGEITYFQDTKGNDRITYFLLPEYRGRGLMDKAYEAFVDKLKEEKSLTELFATVSLHNTSSFRFLLRRGFNYDGWGQDITRDSPSHQNIKYYMSRTL